VGVNENPFAAALDIVNAVVDQQGVPTVIPGSPEFLGAGGYGENRFSDQSGTEIANDGFHFGEFGHGQPLA
jgi:hypothetical protein